MKRVTMMAAALAVMFAAAFLVVSGCKKTENKVLRIGATAVPHAEILAQIADDLDKQGIDLEIIEFTDYITPNTALIAGDLDANFHQHIPYLESNSLWAETLVSAFGVHIEPFGLYSKKYADINGLPDGADIAIPNDPSNGGRALLLLQDTGLIRLKPDAGLEATDLDIVYNPKNIKFRALEAAQLPRSLDDVDAACINGNYALEANLSPINDTLALEDADSPYVNIVVVRKGTENDPRILALRDAVISDKIRSFITNNWPNGSVVPIF